MCIAPITLQKPVEERSFLGENAQQVPCGKCPKCLRRRQADWCFRLMEESKQSTSSIFLTLTYEKAPKSVNGLDTLVKKDWQDFMKRLRKKYQLYDRIKYYAVGEYGSRTNRPHYHAIMFNVPKRVIQNVHLVDKTWNRGHVMLAPCNGATVAYTTKYVMSGKWKPDDYFDKETGQKIRDDRQPAFSTMSKGMGLCYLTPQMRKYHKERLIGLVTKRGGYTQALPRYFKDILFTDEEKKIITEELQQFAVDFNNLFNDRNHKTQWKKDQYRKAEKRKLQGAKL